MRVIVHLSGRKRLWGEQQQSAPLLLLLLQASTLLSSSRWLLQSQAANSPDMNNLLALKQAFAVSYPDALSTWTSASDPCEDGSEWQGKITCNGNGYVEELVLTNELLKGPIPGPQLADLRMLLRLDLGYNMLDGELPIDLSVLSLLTFLSFEGNKISGGLPDFLGPSLQNLVSLRLSNNELNGTIPTSIGSLSTLKTLDLGSNQFDGPLPDVISTLDELQYLSMSANKLSGFMPTWFASLSQLRILELYSNDLEGTIPSQLGLATNLISIALDENKLSGSLPSSLGNLQAINALYIASNQLEGPIPDSLSKLSNLMYIDISYNEALNGTLPEYFGNLQGVESLAFEFCSLSGPLPSTLGKLSKLVEVFLDNNQFTGTIPESLGQLAALNKLYLNHNNLQGSIPSSLCSMTNIMEINLARNQLDSSIPACLMELPKLTLLTLTSNELTGDVPAVSDPDAFHFQYDDNCLTNAADQKPDCSPAPGGTDGDTDSSPSPTFPPGTEVLDASGPPPPPSSSGTATLAMFIILIFFTLVLFVAIFAALLWTYQKNRSLPATSRTDQLPVTEYSLSKIKKATKNFSMTYGKGSFGTVYLAEDFLRDQPEGRAIIKRAQDPQKLGEFLFKCKVEVLARARHRYLVNLLGFCVGKGERILVYEFLPNGTLFDRLHRPELEPLPWETRVKIAVNVACALEHLHHGISPPLVHRAVTSSNVLLAADMSAKLSDFGIARGSGGPSSAMEETPRRKKSRSHRDRGDSGSLTLQMEKVDVYGFGVVLLELITGQKAMKEVHITSVAAPFLEDPQMMPLMVDPQLGGYFNQSELIELGTLAKDCVQDDAAARPSMRDVLHTMEERLRIDSQIFDNNSDDDSLTEGYSAHVNAAGYARHNPTSSSSVWSSLENFAQSVKSVFVKPKSQPMSASHHAEPPDLEMSSLLVMSGNRR